MNPLSQPVRCHSGVTSVSAVLSCLLALCGYLAAGCGSARMPSVTVPPPAPPPTSVAVVMSSTANNQFTSFYVDITSISLTNQAGTMVSVLAAPQSKVFTQTQEAEIHSFERSDGAFPHGDGASGCIHLGDAYLYLCPIHPRKADCVGGLASSVI